MWLRSAVRRLTDPDEYTIVSLAARGERRGRALLAYLIEPFLLPEGTPVPVSHTNYWESLQMAETLLDLGYDVDVISYRSTTFRPRKRYDVFLGARVNFARIAEQLNEGCTKIVHLDTAHWLFNNTAAHQRYYDLLQRRGVALPFSRKQVEQNWAIERADFATILGNDFTVGTYAYANKRIYRLPIPACLEFPDPRGKDFDAVRRNFVWFGSQGLVHKGLDLVLEAFALMPDHRLTVCGPVAEDRRFKETYARELYGLPNITTAGWVDIDGPSFTRIVGDSVGIVYPSAAEGQAGSVVTCLQAGLIPLLTKESGLDVDGFGLVLGEASVDGVQAAVRQVSSLPANELEARAMGAWRTARAGYTRERYAQRHREVIKEILALGGSESAVRLTSAQEGVTLAASD